MAGNMKFIRASIYSVLFTILISFAVYSQNAGSKLNLMPIPQSTILMPGKFRIEKDFSLTVRGNPGDRIYSAATRMLRHLSGRTGLFFTQDYITKNSGGDTSQLVISCEQPGKLGIDEEESYILNISADRITLSAKTDLGALHGLQTLLQLLKSDENGYYFPDVEIKDKPRFKWRGLMIDVARHFMPVNVIKRNLNVMEAVKLNVLHLHLSDDQGFRVESKVYPKLTQLGSDGKYFTQEQIKDIVKYASERGIRVIPEFDVPAHTACWFAAYPKLASGPGPYSISRTWGVHNPVLNPTIDATYKFLDNLFGEMAKLFPDPYFHIGGDENNGVQWSANKEILAFMKKHNIPDNHALQTYFNKRLLKIITKQGKKMIGWDEILQPGMPKNIVIQSWRGQAALFKAAREGYMGILSNGYYIDLNQHAGYHYLNDPIPPDSIVSEKVKNNVLGGEATMWSEMVTPENVDSRIWPRTAAIAERLWSPQNIRDVKDMYRRLAIISVQLEDFGSTHLRNYGMMLRRLTDGKDITDLKTFVDIVEPVKGYKRGQLGVTYLSYSPYTRVVDAARPESQTARKFNDMVDSYIKTKDESTMKEIISWLTLWKSNNKELSKTINTSHILKEIEPMSENLTKLAQVGLETLSLIKENKKAGTQWLTESNKIISDAQFPYGQVELAIIPGIQKLVDAVK